MKAEDYAKIFKALSHPARLQIACGLMHKGRCNVNTMCERLKMSQSLVSQHINILKTAGIIKGFRDGNIIWYEIIDELTKKLLSNISLNVCDIKDID